MVVMTTAVDIAALDAPQMTLLFLATVAALATALIIMFGELERSEKAARIRVSLSRLIDRSSRFSSSRDERDP